jgi:uncharacterized membrane protein
LLNLRADIDSRSATFLVLKDDANPFKEFEMSGKTLIADIARKVLERAERPISKREEQVLADMQNRSPSTSNAQNRAALGDTYWDRLADRVAQIGGSWAFIFSFAAILVFWMVLNSEILADWNLSFDPYPFIFLNLLLSTVAAIQAPVIMMSQNRQNARDRIAAMADYETNLRAELEIMALHEKWDHAKLAELEAKMDSILTHLKENPRERTDDST